MKKINEIDTTLSRQRIYEVDFYHYIARLLEGYNQQALLLDLIDVFAKFGEGDPLVVKALVRDVLTDTGTWRPTREETILVYRKLNLSMREIKKRTGINPNTQYAILAKMAEDKSQIPSVVPKLRDDVFLNVKSFMDQVTIFKGV
jgi:hypothetical protein